MAHSSDYLKLHFIVFLWGFSAILGRLVSVPAVELVFFRSVLAALGMGAVIWYVKDRFRVEPADLARLLLIGCIVAVHWLTFFGSARVSNVSVSLVGFATNSLWAALLEPWFNRTRPKIYELGLGLLVLGGLYVIFSFDFQYRWGLVLSVIAGFTSALFSVFNAQLVRRISPKTITLYEMVGAAIALGIFVGGHNALRDSRDQFTLNPNLTDIVYLTILAGACSVYAYTVGVELMRRMSVFTIQLTLNLEPIYGIIMAVIIFGEREKMNLNFYLGAAIILGGVLAYPILKRRFEKSSKANDQRSDGNDVAK